MAYAKFKTPKPGTMEHDFMLLLSSILPEVNKCRSNWGIGGLVEYSYPHAVGGEALVSLAKLINYLDLGNNFSIGHAGGQTILSIRTYRASIEAFSKRVSGLIEEAKKEV